MWRELSRACSAVFYHYCTFVGKPAVAQEFERVYDVLLVDYFRFELRTGQSRLRRLFLRQPVRVRYCIDSIARLVNRWFDSDDLVAAI